VNIKIAVYAMILITFRKKYWEKSTLFYFLKNLGLDRILRNGKNGSWYEFGSKYRKKKTF